MLNSLPFRAIVSDLDGTLLNTHHKIGNFTTEILEQLAQKGVDIFLATGRNYPDVKHIISKINLDDAMLITSNGARTNKLSGEVLSNEYLPETIAFELMNIDFDETKVCINTYQGDDWFINKDIPELKQFHIESGYCYKVVNFSTHHSKQTEKVCYLAKQADDLNQIEQYIIQQYSNQVQITRSLPYCLEVMNKGVCKANALEKLVKLKGYTMADCIAFGDGLNDIEMLSRVGKGCIMSNADQNLKIKLPQNEIIGSNKDEAVAHYLQKLFG
ncbi:Cof-type HAD-IIB family hydrolase [Pasteurella atlantica]|uniref:Cof-type HAD-IIB family hydrolase n=2 Tax=Pasteurellaceae TaxID=712 RepID=A0ACC6HMX1_9PAST|nr:Cof-type HAD-IIB family hydrolase [Pasteurella atlantica]MDP8052158.1 Cof-type HAD-IIB family hydrolase [Pasteurella atlantica]MDP8101241.1 Cof-type HAD-IIB family hydrolase [Pasteurella atlantica]MDP8105049.1 Cof-type HAD-IIB family hydrolase [Pasteurella atlantica]MDP8148534.1 Cof-type HAD-IIB family hydrolase [Pasteurella atlantica]